ncbi:MAG TPA: S8 family serine peptidase [Actinomycetota bacterium]|nr:S8 family serine peptidase [Actinomycetota bacterium]
MSRRSIPVLVVLLLCASLVPAASASGRAGAYIVVLRAGAAPGAVAAEHARGGARVGHVYDDALNGYSATMSDVAAARIANDSRVSYVVPDGEVHKTAITQSPVTWGLDRIDERARDSVFSYTYEATGAGVTAYVIDTGISSGNQVAEFSGRVTSGWDFVEDHADSADCDGHGTHVAGTIGSETYGVAKDVSLVGVRVLNCSGSGSWSDVIAGIEWVTDRHLTQGGPSVANMSLGGGANQAVDDAVRGSTDAGVVYAVSAGNGNSGGKAQDACFYSPARAASALTVGATSSSDTKASWSNYGTCVDLFAPGVGITSTVMGGGTESWSGTSMAAPHVAGVAALYLEANPTAGVAATTSAIIGEATTGLVKSAGTGSPNRLLYSLFGAGTITPPPNSAPVANNDSASTAYQTAVAINVLGNDTDADGDELSVGSVTQPAAGSVSVNTTTQTVTYTPPAGYSGTTTFSYQATDGTASSNSATVTVTVAADTSTPPPTGGITLQATAYKVKGKQKVDLTWGGAAGPVDISRDGVTISSSAPSAGTMTDNIDRNGNGTYVYEVCEVGAPATCAQVTVRFN